MTADVPCAPAPGSCPACGRIIPVREIDGRWVECPRCRRFREVAEVVPT